MRTDSGLAIYANEIRYWLNADPIGLAGGLNLYAYVGNKPINGIDPLGLRSGDVDALISGFSGGGANSLEGLVSSYYSQQHLSTAGQSLPPAVGIGIVAIPVVAVAVGAPEVLAAGAALATNQTALVIAGASVVAGTLAEGPLPGELEGFGDQAEQVAGWLEQRGVENLGDIQKLSGHIATVWQSIAGSLDEIQTENEANRPVRKKSCP